MPRANTRNGEEIWQTTTAGTVWVPITDDRGRERQVEVGGNIGARLRIKKIDREVAQERIFAVESDPFRNGMLKRVDADQNADEATASTQALSPEELAGIFAKNGNQFQKAVDGLNEINVRRMYEMTKDLEVTIAQQSYLKQVIEEKYRKHGDTPTYREMMAIGEVGRG